MSDSLTLEDELLKLSGVQPINKALAKLGLLRSADMPFEIVDISGKWFRSGAETYLYHFSVRDGDTEHVLALKACVAFSPGTALEEILKSWVDRRELLTSRGAKAPVLYGWGNGVLLEEFIPFSLREVIEKEPANLEQLLLSMADLGGVVASLRFAPVELFGDLRSRGNDVVLVDYGQDLGPAAVTPEDNLSVYDQLTKYLEVLGQKIDASLASKLRLVFHAQSQTPH